MSTNIIEKITTLKSTVYLVLGAGLMLIIGSGLGSYYLIESVKSEIYKMQQNQVKIGALERLTYLDEVLTQNARYYVYFGNEIDRKEYDLHVLEIDQLREEMTEYDWDEGSESIFELYDKYDSSLGSYENQAMDIYNADLRDSARQMLFDEKYMGYKENIAKNISMIREEEQLGRNETESELRSSLDWLSYTFFISVMLIGTFLLLLGVLWNIISRIFKRNSALYSNLAISVSKEKASEKTQEVFLKDLQEYAHLTSHSLRAPLARLQGIIQMIDGRKDEAQLEIFLDLIRDTSLEMDNITKEMNEILTRNSYKGIHPI